MRMHESLTQKSNRTARLDSTNVSVAVIDKKGRFEVNNIVLDLTNPRHNERRDLII
jgi:hypothetical protein